MESNRPKASVEWTPTQLSWLLSSQETCSYFWHYQYNSPSFKVYLVSRSSIGCMFLCALVSLHWAVCVCVIFHGNALTLFAVLNNCMYPCVCVCVCLCAGVAKLLLEYGANINTHSNEFKESALTLACYKGHLDMVKFLLSAGTACSRHTVYS